MNIALKKDCDGVNYGYSWTRFEFMVDGIYFPYWIDYKDGLWTPFEIACTGE